ncbi:MAG: SanA protein, partial [Clostridium sp.]|nr:SanA protein [Clostridium sp.]
KAIMSTNKDHLPRAMYIARRIGMEAYGIASDGRQYDRMKKYKKRERLAQIKDFFLVNLFRRKFN